MTKAINVTNPLVYQDESLERIVKSIGRSKLKKSIFCTIYSRGKKPKTAEQIAQLVGENTQSVRNSANELANDGIIARCKTDNRSTAYYKQEYITGLKPKVLNLLKNPIKIKEIPTLKNAIIASKNTKSTIIDIKINRNIADTEMVTIDDIDSFRNVKNIRFSENKKDALNLLNEEKFKNGVQKIIGESGTFKDWGGETSDLMSTRLLLNGKRIAAAFAFKGPGLKTKLVTGKMGKNGDQGQRLFREAAEIFIVQHWHDIDPHVLELLALFAAAKSAELSGRKIYYGTIDGKDSARLVAAYEDCFFGGGQIG